MSFQESHFFNFKLCSICALISFEILEYELLVQVNKSKRSIFNKIVAFVMKQN